MATKKITELSQANTVANNDLLVIVTNPSSLSETKKVTVNTFFSNTYATKITAATLVANSVTINSNATFSGATTINGNLLVGGMTATANISFQQVLTANQIAILDSRTPANSAIDVARGTMFYDNTYIYIAVGTNVVKRVALESF